MKVDAGVVSACRSCGRSNVELQVVSEHRTAKGVIRYSRCTCGALQVLFRSHFDSEWRPLGGQRVPAVA